MKPQFCILFHTSVKHQVNGRMQVEDMRTECSGEYMDQSGSKR